MDLRLFKKLRFLTIVLIFSTVNIQAVEVKNSVEAVLSLGGQMSNVRKMLETYALIGTKVAYRAPNERLKASILEYESILDALEKNFKDSEIQQSVQKSRVAWKPVKEALLTALTNTDEVSMKKNALFIHGNIRSVIKELASMKTYLLEKANVKGIDNLNATIEIGASARRLSAHYMMKMWELDDPTIQKHWDKGIKIYGDSLKVLQASSFAKNPEFKILLDECNKNYRYFIMVSKFKNRYVPVLVHEKAKLVFDNANKMTEIVLSQILK